MTEHGWTIHLELAGDPAPYDVGPAVEELLERLGDYSPAVAVAPDHDRLSITIALEGEGWDAPSAVTEAAGVVRGYVDKVGLPRWPIVHTEAMTWAEHDRELEQPAYPALAGVAELAEILGVTPQRVSTMRRTHAGFPAPIAELRSGPVWVRDHVTRFAESWTRKPGRPTKVTLDAAKLNLHARDITANSDD